MLRTRRIVIKQRNPPSRLYPAAVAATKLELAYSKAPFHTDESIWLVKLFAAVCVQYVFTTEISQATM